MATLLNIACLLLSSVACLELNEKGKEPPIDGSVYTPKIIGERPTQRPQRPQRPHTHVMFVLHTPSSFVKSRLLITR